MSKKKSQLHMMETVIVLLFVFVLLSLGIIFYISHQKSKIKDKDLEFKGLDLIKKAQVLNFFPELECSFDGLTKPDCYDMIKVGIFNDIRDNYYLYYDEVLKEMKIEIKKFDPETSEWDSWTIYNKPKKKSSDTRPMFIPISLYNTTEDSYYFGVIYLEVYQ